MAVYKKLINNMAKWVDKERAIGYVIDDIKIPYCNFSLIQSGGGT